MGAFGLQSHIWNNNLKSILLLLGFPVLLLLLFFALSLIFVTLSQDMHGVYAMEEAAEITGSYWFLAFAAAAAWFAIAWFANQTIIRLSVGAKKLERKDAPDLYNMLENLCISRGMPMPRLNIINTQAMNAFASGIDEKSYTITVTQGLLDNLNDNEVEAVLAHELTHIMNRDVRLLIIAVIFVGIFAFFAEMIFRSFTRTGVRVSGHTRSRNGDSRGGGLLILVALAIIILAYFLAVMIRFALSRKREFLADAGAAELTKNPDAMISALKKISGRSEIDAPAEVQQMMLENTERFAGIFTTHPPIEKRIEALVNFAGGEA